MGGSPSQWRQEDTDASPEDRSASLSCSPRSTSPPIFQRLLRRAVTRKAEGYHLKVAALDDLERMKRASGRAIDLADIALIRERRRLS